MKKEDIKQSKEWQETLPADVIKEILMGWNIYPCLKSKKELNAWHKRMLWHVNEVSKMNNVNEDNIDKIVTLNEKITKLEDKIVDLEMELSPRNAQLLLKSLNVYEGQLLSQIEELTQEEFDGKIKPIAELRNILYKHMRG